MSNPSNAIKRIVLYKSGDTHSKIMKTLQVWWGYFASPWGDWSIIGSNQWPNIERISFTFKTHENWNTTLYVGSSLVLVFWTDSVKVFVKKKISYNYWQKEVQDILYSAKGIFFYKHRHTKSIIMKQFQVRENISN